MKKQKFSKFMYAFLSMCLIIIGCSESEPNKDTDNEDIYNNEKQAEIVNKLRDAGANGLFIKDISQSDNKYKITLTDNSTYDIILFTYSASNNLVREITSDDYSVVFSLCSGDKFEIRHEDYLRVNFSSEYIAISPGETKEIAFTVESRGDVTVEPTATAGASVSINFDKQTGHGSLKVSTSDNSGKEYVAVVISNKKRIITRRIDFEEYQLKIVDNTNKTVSEQGGYLSVEFLSNTDYELNISSEGNWISLHDSREPQKKTLTFSVAPNEGESRQATITISAHGGELSLTYTVIQETNLAYQLALEREILVNFYKSTNGDNWHDSYNTNCNENWLSDKPVGTWYGIKTDEKGRVTELRFTSDGLSGVLPDNICKLRNLKVFRVVGNKEMTGTIPPDMNQCPDLETFYLESSNITGEIPPELFKCKKLKYVLLGFLNITGTVPETLGEAESLEFLGWAGTKIEGPIPKSVGRLKKLQKLYIHQSLTSELPEELSLCENLKIISMYGCPIKSLPQSLGKSLIHVDMQDCGIEGKIPPPMLENDELWHMSWGYIVHGNRLDIGIQDVPPLYFASIHDFDRNEYSSKDIFSQNRLTVFITWETWCPASEATIIRLRDLYAEYCVKGLGIYGFTGAGSSEAKKYNKEHGVSWPTFSYSESAFYKSSEMLPNLYSPEHYEYCEPPYPYSGYVPIVTMFDSAGNVVWSDCFNSPSEMVCFIEDYFADAD